MLESLLFMLLVFTGGMGLLFSAVAAIVGLAAKNSTARQLSVGALFIPLCSWGLIGLWYYVIVPLIS